MIGKWAFVGIFAALSMSFATASQASWGPGQGAFRDTVLNCIDSVGEWGDDFFCLGFVCRGSELQLMHVAAGGNFASRLQLVIKKGRGADDALYDLHFTPDQFLSAQTGTLVETSPVSRQMWQDIMRSHTIVVGPGAGSEYTTGGLERFTEALMRRCRPV